ncbi:hypothetical protein ACFVX6_20635 [Streptomyces sp. NPDC058289]|uniref:hypothetical protein n=1 Tax=Streptomyces sp. NPDC058289 TaxID=3346425 RepID=UPI0036E4D3D8
MSPCSWKPTCRPRQPRAPLGGRPGAALQQSAEDADRAVRDHRVPTWEPVRTALDTWHDEAPGGEADRMLHRAGVLLLAALEKLSTALEYASPPMTTTGAAPRAQLPA